MRAIVNEQGDLVVSRHALRNLGLHPGAVLEVSIDSFGQDAKRDSVLNSLNSVYGSVDLGMSTDEYMDMIRGHE